MKHLIKYTDYPLVLRRVYCEIDITQWSQISQKLMAHLHLHVRGRPQVCEVTCVLGGRGKGKGGGGGPGKKPGCPYNLLIYLDHVDMIDGVTRLGDPVCW